MGESATVVGWRPPIRSTMSVTTSNRPSRAARPKASHRTPAEHGPARIGIAHSRSPCLSVHSGTYCHGVRVAKGACPQGRPLLPAREPSRPLRAWPAAPTLPLMSEAISVELAGEPQFSDGVIRYRIKNVGESTIGRHSVTDHVHLYKRGEHTRTDTVMVPESDIEPGHEADASYEVYLDGWDDAVWSAGVQINAEQHNDVVWVPFYVQDMKMHAGQPPGGLGESTHPDHLDPAAAAGPASVEFTSEPAFSDGSVRYNVRNAGQATIVRQSLKDLVHLYKQGQHTRTDTIAMPGDHDVEPGHEYEAVYEPYLDGWDDADWTAGVQINSEHSQDIRWVYFAVQNGHLVGK